MITNIKIERHPNGLRFTIKMEEIKQYLIPYLLLINLNPWDDQPKFGNFCDPSAWVGVIEPWPYWSIKYEKWIHYYNAYVAPDATGVLENNRFYVEGKVRDE